MSLDHPPKDHLIAFGQGKLAAEESSSVEQHLEVCRECCETLLDLRDDTFVGLVRIAQPGNSDRRLGTLARPAAESSETETDKARTGKIAQPTESATVLVQSGEPIAADELPSELADHPRYHIVELIGRGGMGNVYRAEHRLMNRPVAIKLINSQLIRQPQAVERFRREVQAAAKLTHPNIVTAYDAEQAGDVHFLVMEFVEGTDLASVVKHRGAMSVAEACECIRQAAEGLQHAHEKGMVHRDIKPHNLMLSSGGQVRILDFGLAGFASEALGCHVRQNVGGRPIDDDASVIPPPSGDGGYEATAAHLTTAGSVMGTPDYMAPEQAADAHSADIRADIYSLGCTLHYLLSGQPPFEVNDIVGKLKAHAQESPPALTTLRNDVPGELANVVSRMLAKDPAQRFQTPAEVAEAVTPFAQSATSPPRRHRKTLTAALAVAAMLLAGVIVVATARGRLEIQSEVDDVQVVVEQGGEQVAIFDLKTGSQVKWLPTGDYELKLKGGENDITLDQRQLTMSRLGQVIVTARWNTEGRGTLVNFNPPAEPITQDGVEVADGSWKITAADTRTVRLFETPLPPLAPGPFFYRAKLKTENVKARAYLEMWVRFPGEGEFFSKGFHNAVSGTNGWAEYEVPFYLKKGQQPDQAKLNLTIEGSGTVWIKDIQLRGRQTATPEEPHVMPALDNSQREALKAAEAFLAVMDEGRFGQLFDMGSMLAKKATTREQVSRTYQQLRDTAGKVEQRTLQSVRSFDEFIGLPPGRYAAVLYRSDFEKHKGLWESVLLNVDEDGQWRPNTYAATVQPLPLPETKKDSVIEQKLQLATSAAQDWLELVDAGKYGESWDASAKNNRDGIGKQQMIDAYKELFQPLGAIKSRTFKSSEYKTQMPRAPVGEYAVIQFNTQFTDGRIIEAVILILESDGQWHVAGYRHAEDNSPPTPPPATSKPPQRKTGLLTNPPKLPPEGVLVGRNLIVDPSLEGTRTGELPSGWFAWLDDGPDFKCEVVEGGVTGKHCLQISGTGTRGVVFATSIPLDRTKRYALKGRVKVEGEAGTWAVIKLNYFDSTGWLGVDDRIGVSSSDFDSKLLEKTDLADKYPAATLLVPTCHIEGNGTAWFDDLEVIAYDRDKLPENFDATHGKNNRMK